MRRTPPTVFSLRGPMVLGFAVLLLTAGVATAQVPVGVQEYFVLGWERHVWDFMDRVQNNEGGAALDLGMNSVVTATVSADNQIIFYDHWEDGLDTGLDAYPDDTFATPGAAPNQTSTLVLGDGDPSNGAACDFNSSACPNDTLFRGDFVNFASDQGLVSDGAGACVVPNDPGSYPELCNAVEILGRCAGGLPCAAADFRFDGGDFIKTNGGPLSLVHSQYPLTQFIGGSTEILSQQAVEAARSYSVPIGENLYVANTETEPFHYVELELVAFEDTNIFVDSPGAGSVAFTLARGEHWSSMGFINDVFTPGLAITVNSGTKVSTSAAIGGFIFTGGDGTWATRHYALLPDIAHGTDYVTTAPGDDPNLPAGGTDDRPANVYILNPDPFNPLTVNITDSSGTDPVTIPPNSMEHHIRDIPGGSTVRITSDRNFWGVTGYDYDTNVSDWGHSWLATSFLTGEYTVSYGPGNQDPTTLSQLANPVFVAPVLDRTLVRFDLDNDGAFDAVDLDWDGVADPVPNNIYTVDAGEALVVHDPVANDMTGARIRTNKPVAVSWGQNTDNTDYNDDALDTGFTIFPITDLFLDPVLTIDKTVDVKTVPLAGGNATYTLTVKSHDYGQLTNLSIWDILPPGVTAADYVPGSTLITYPNLVQAYNDPVEAGTGAGTLTWMLSPDTLEANRTISIRYSVAVPAAPDVVDPPAGGDPRLLTNEGHAEAWLGGSIFSPFDDADVVQTDISLTKTVDQALPRAGEIITFFLEVTNTGIFAESNVFIVDPIPANTTFVPGSIPEAYGAFDALQNAVVWTVPGTLDPSEVLDLSFQVRVNPATPPRTVITNVAGYESDQTPYFLSNEVEPVVQGPELTVSKAIVGNPTLVHPGETVAFEVFVDNTGTAAANDVRIVDFIVANTSYVPGSMQLSLNAGLFRSLTDVADGDEGEAFADRVEVLYPELGVSQDITFRFSVIVDAGTDFLFVNNQAVVASDEVLPRDTNLVQVPIVGDALLSGHVFLDLDGDGVQDPGEPDLANLDVQVTDATGVTQTVVTDANGDYSATVDVVTVDNGTCAEDDIEPAAYDGSDGALPWASRWFEVGYGADISTGSDPLSIRSDPLGGGNNVLRIEGGNGSSASRGFTRAVDLSNAITATLSFDFFREDLESADRVVVSMDYDGAGPNPPVEIISIGQPIDGSEDDTVWQNFFIELHRELLPTANAVLRFDTLDDGGSSFSSTTDQFHIDNVDICIREIASGGANVTLDVDESDPDFPAGATLSTANDPQVVAASLGSPAVAPDVGYDPRPMTFGKESDAPNHEVVPGQTITYTLTTTNYSSTTQTGIQIVDPLPPGTSFVADSVEVTTQQAASVPFRVTEYYFAPGGPFSGASQLLTLDQDLADDYFVIIQGSAGDGSGGTNRGPNANYVSLTNDPHGNFAGAPTAANQLALTRQNGADDWVGVVAVVECVEDCAVNGFELLDVARVAHTGTATSGFFDTGTAWDPDQVMLMGGFNGAGCDTTDAQVADTKVCHVRFFPDPGDVQRIQWTRNNQGGVTLSTATSTVMVVEWGSAWGVEHLQVTGTAGGDGAASTAFYDTGALTEGAVDPASTWVWGTGHTADNGLGDAAEAVLITLGDGVLPTPDPASTVALGSEYNDNKDFEVWVLTHPLLVVEHDFKTDGDSGALTWDRAVSAVGSESLALSYNSCNGTGTAYPRPMFSARMLGPGTVRLERRRSGQPFTAWLQAVDFTSIGAAGGLVTTPLPGNAAPDILDGSEGFTLAHYGTMTVTFQVVVDQLIDVTAIPQILNQATITTDTVGPLVDSVADDVLSLNVSVEPDNSGLGLPGETLTYSHVVVNDGEVVDSYEMTAASENGWPMALIDPNTGVIIATDYDDGAGGPPDGIWDNSVSINTGSLQPGESKAYDLRLTIPPGAAIGTTETNWLIATSDRSSVVNAVGVDETLVVDVGDLGAIVLVPDQSGVITPSGFRAYTHTIYNNQAFPDTFDLRASPTGPDDVLGNPWDAKIYFDNNGDGVYTPGFDVEINNTFLLDPGEQQTFFVVVEAPPGNPPLFPIDGDVDVTHITATSRADTDVFTTATDTTTVVEPEDLDLSGGGTRYLPSDDPHLSIPVYPGTLTNLQLVGDTFDLTLSPSPFFGPGGDGRLHPTELWVDTDDDDVPDLLVAEDTIGDGVWDFLLDPATWDSNMDGNPDLSVAALDVLAYELRRPVEATQGPMRDWVTLTATSQGAGEADSVTATGLLARATHVVFSTTNAFASDSGVIVEWKTALEVGTLGFEVLRRSRRDLTFDRVGPGILPATLHAEQGGSYSWIDRSPSTSPSAEYRVVEWDVWGRSNRSAPIPVTIGSAESRDPGGPDYQSQAHESPVHRFPVRERRAQADAELRSGAVKIAVNRFGLVRVDAEDLAEAFSVAPTTVNEWILSGTLAIGRGADELPVSDLIFADNFESGSTERWPLGAKSKAHGSAQQVPWLAAADGGALYFVAEAIDSIFTDEVIYWAIPAQGLWMAENPSTVSSPVAVGSFADLQTYEIDQWVYTAGITDPDSDFWFWEFFNAQDPATSEKTVAIEVPDPVATGGSVLLAVHLQGAAESSASPNHLVEVRLNDVMVGATSWSGITSHSETFAVDHALLVDGTNQVTISTALAPGDERDKVYLDALELEYLREERAHDDLLVFDHAGPGPVTVAGFSEADILVLDITDPQMPVSITNGSVDTADGAYRITFDTNQPSSRLLVTTWASVGGPTAVWADRASDLRNPANAASHLIVAAPGLEAAAADYAAQRRGVGVDSLAVNAEDIYDEFNSGVVSPWAIRDFLAFATTSWAVPPTSVLFMGDSSLDFKNQTGAGHNLLISPMISTPYGLVPSDHRLTDLSGDDGIPELATGRLPAVSADEVSAYATTLEVFETAQRSWLRRLTWLADDPDEGGLFLDDSEALIAAANPNFEHERIYFPVLGLDETRARFMAALDRGTLLSGYIGHGGMGQLGDRDEELFTLADLPNLDNPEAPFIFMALTCSVGRFDMFAFTPLGEALSLHDRGGAVAVWASTGLAMNVASLTLGQEFVSRLDSAPTIGEAIRLALIQSAATIPEEDRYLLYTYVLLGDPTAGLGVVP